MQSEPSKFDVVVIGAGPAGLACAITLARETDLSVALVNRRAVAPGAIGELLPSGAWVLTEILGVSDRLISEQAVQPCFLAAKWSTQYLCPADSNSLAPVSHIALDRRAFDRILLCAAYSAGAAVESGSTVKSFSRCQAGGWEIKISTPGTHRVVAGRILVDATGRRAIVARRLSHRITLDDLVAIVDQNMPDGEFSGPATAVIESADYGWWYHAQLGPDRSVTALLTDRSYVRRCRLFDRDNWDVCLRRTSEVVRFARKSGASDPLRVYSASSAVSEQTGGRDWIAIGEAAVSYDPISSLGIAYAMLSGVCGARAVASALDGHSTAISSYNEDVKSHFNEYLRQRSACYAMPQSRSTHVFWSARTGCASSIS